MILRIVSDLHLDHHKDRGNILIQEIIGPVETVRRRADTLVIAGDLCDGSNTGLLLSALERFCDAFKHVVYVPGNHDHCGFGVPASDVAAWFKILMKPPTIVNLTVLYNSSADIGGVGFAGGTGWYPEPTHLTAWAGREQVEELKQRMIDFRHIKDFEPWVYQQNKEFLDLLSFTPAKDVWVTHHLPSHRSVAPRFKRDALNAFFLNDPIEAYIRAREPKLVVHGHTHDPFDYEIGTSRVVCNPFGYPRERQSASFNPAFDIEV